MPSTAFCPGVTVSALPCAERDGASPRLMWVDGGGWGSSVSLPGHLRQRAVGLLLLGCEPFAAGFEVLSASGSMLSEGLLTSRRVCVGVDGRWSGARGARLLAAASRLYHPRRD